VVAAAAAVLVLTVLRRRVSGPLLLEPTRGTPMATVGGTAFAVLLAFVTFAAFQTYNGAKTGAQSEAVAVLELFRTAALYPATERDELRADFVCYGRAVVAREWPAMRAGHRSALVDRWVSAYRDSFSRLALASPREQIGLQEMLTEARNRTDGRRDRLSQVTPSVPTPLWIVLVLGGCIAVMLQLGMADRRERLVVQGAMVAGVAATVTAGLVLVNFLDHPYGQHTGSIQPTEMRRTLQMTREQAPALRLPCDARGEEAQT
jgi:Protein of unknown function (DUF4239)